MRSVQTLFLAALVFVVAAQDAPSSVSSSAPASMETGTVMLPAEVENCHAHGSDIYCFAGEEEWEITSDNAAIYDGQSLSSCETGTAESSISCDAIDGTEITLLRGGAAEEDHDHIEGETHDHSHDKSTSTAIPSEVTNCHAHGEEIFCFAGEAEWEITSENAASYDRHNLTACETSAGTNSKISCDSENGAEVTLAQEATHDDDDDDDAASGTASATPSSTATPSGEAAAVVTGDNAGSTVMASVGFSVMGLVVAAFVL